MMPVAAATIGAALLALATVSCRTLPLTHGGRNMEPFLSDEQEYWEVSDDEHGVHCHITPMPTQVVECGVYDVAGTKWYERSSELADGKLATIRLRNTPETYCFAATNQRLPMIIRNNAVIDLFGRLGLPRDYLLGLAENHLLLDRKATIRYNVLNHVGDDCKQQYRERVIGICVRSLSDPCMDVAVNAAGILHVLFNLRDEVTGKKIESPGATRSGPALHHYATDQYYVEQVAVHMHRLHPRIVSTDDVDKVTSLRVPSDEWFRHMYGQSWKDQKKDYPWIRTMILEKTGATQDTPATHR